MICKVRDKSYVDKRNLMIDIQKEEEKLNLCYRNTVIEISQE